MPKTESFIETSRNNITIAILKKNVNVIIKPSDVYNNRMVINCVGRYFRNILNIIVQYYSISFVLNCSVFALEFENVFDKIMLEKCINIILVLVNYSCRPTRICPGHSTKRKYTISAVTVYGIYLWYSSIYVPYCILKKILVKILRSSSIIIYILPHTVIVNK